MLLLWSSGSLLLRPRSVTQVSSLILLKAKKRGVQQQRLLHEVESDRDDRDDNDWQVGLSMFRETAISSFCCTNIDGSSLCLKPVVSIDRSFDLERVTSD